MATSNFRQYAPPSSADMQYLDNPLSSIQQPTQPEYWQTQRPGFEPLQNEDLNKPYSPRTLDSRNIQGLTAISPGQPTNKPLDLSGFDQTRKAKPWERGGGKELVNSGLTKILGKGMMTKGGGLAGKLASKGGILGKLGKGAASSPTPWMAGGMAAGALGDLIAKKHAKTGGAIGGAGKGAATGAMIGSVIPGIGTAIGGVAGGLIGGIKGFFGGKKKNKEKKAAEAAAKAGAPGLSTIGGQGPNGSLGRVVGSDPYGQLRAETEARYRPLDTSYTPFTPMPMIGGTPAFQTSTNPWDGGGDALGGRTSWGG